MYRSVAVTALAANPRGNRFWWIWKLIWFPNWSEVVSRLRCSKLQSLYSQIDNWNQSKKDIMSHDGNGILSLEKCETQCGQTLSILNGSSWWVLPVWQVPIHDYEWVNELIDKGIMGGQAMHEWWRIILESIIRNWEWGREKERHKSISSLLKLNPLCGAERKTTE